MTDGIDNALPDVPGPGSSLPFEGLIDKDQEFGKYRVSDLPRYRRREREAPPRSALGLRAGARTARADGGVCGTPLYRAARLSDLDAVYAQVVRDLSTVYSIGYQPTNKTLDGKWRSVEVRLMNRSDLFARTKRGYYAKTGVSGLTLLLDPDPRYPRQLLKLVNFPEPTIMLKRAFARPQSFIANRRVFR